MNHKKGILLYSGGLDSLLAARILMEQNILLTGIHFVSPFTPKTSNLEESYPSLLAKSIGLPLRFYHCNSEYMEIVKDPPHGHGKNMNPCIDCKIYFLKKAKDMMKETNAFFVATGEVVGQRPMSQMKHMLNHIEKESGLRGYLLRPLSARLLRPTIPEMEGMIDRNKLLSINGRSRRYQMELADKYNISDYSSPSGGCLLTDMNISRRLKDLFNYCTDYTMTDVYLLTVGRHYRLHASAKLIVSRNERENFALEQYMNEADYFVAPEFKGPLMFVKGRLSSDDLASLGCIARRYGRSPENTWGIKIFQKNSNPSTIYATGSIEEILLKKMRI
ncbi:MAG: hypothetical protein SVZ03_01135 [Spirochaetota bacterium]|nr:hypothetical protein [Spirochaetota bacterium]